MTEFENPLPSPGVGARRKGPKSLPKLPRSAFSPPNSGTSDKFPLPPSPSTLHPTAVIDSHVSLKDGKLTGWSDTVGRFDPRKIDEIVLALPADSQQAALDQVRKDYPSLKILSVIVPVDLNQGPLSEVPTFGENVKVTLSIRFVQNSAKLVAGLKWALEKGYTVDIDVQAPVKPSGESWEGLEELLSEVLGSEEGGSKVAKGGTIILSNILPPPHDLGISIVKLMNHPAYRAYQSNTASLSLSPSVFVKYTPPNWGAPTPPTSSSQNAEGDSTQESKEKKEWKRRMKMFLGPCVEAFGYQRIIYGSSDPAHDSNASDWYEISRESLAELGVDQEGIDAVFGANVRMLYGA